MDARRFRQEADKLRYKADTKRDAAKRAQQDAALYSQHGDFARARTSQDMEARLEADAVALEKQAVDYEQKAIKMEQEAADLEKQLSNLKNADEHQARDIQNEIRRLLG